jgi:hypothetical protein
MDKQKDSNEIVVLKILNSGRVKGEIKAALLRSIAA